MLVFLRGFCLSNLGVTIPVTHQPRLLPPSGEEAVRRSLTDGRGICKAYGESPNLHKTPTPRFLPSVAFGDSLRRPPQAEEPFSLPRSHCPPSGARNAAPKGRGRAQASGVWQGRAPATKAAASIVQQRRERPAHGRSGVHHSNEYGYAAKYSSSSPHSSSSLNSV